MSSNILAIIPARGGSKRVPRKNIREVGGKPLIAHTIQQAEESDLVDRAIISTDSDKIAQVARDHGGDVPFLRPEELGTDTASVADTITHALEWETQENQEFDLLCSLQVTSPLRTSDDIDGALQRLHETNAHSCMTISKYITPPQWAVATDEDGSLCEFFDCGTLWSDESTRSQDIPDLCHPNGAVFAATTDAWKQHESFYTPNTIGYKMPPERSFDIDEPWELDLIRNLMESGFD